MAQRQQTAVYNCIIPFDELLAVSEQSRTGARKLPYPAWPEIKEKNRQLCFTTLMRAFYRLHRGILDDLETVITRTEDYLSRQEESEREIRQQALALAKTIHMYWQQAVAHGAFPQETSAYIDALRPVVNILVDNGGEWAYEQGMQGLIYGNERNFYTEKDAYSCAHESAHHYAKLSYSGLILDELATQAHKTLHTLATKRLRSERIDKLWGQFWQTNDQLIHLAQKFEPIEEIFATYIGLRFLPAEVRSNIETAVDEAVKARKWERVYQVFSEVCDSLQIPRLGAALTILDLVCRISNQINRDSMYILEKCLEIYKIMTPSITMVQGSNINKDELAILEREAVDKINSLLEQDDISPDTFWSTFDQATENSLMWRLGDAIMNNLSLSNEEQALLFAPIITLIGRPSWQDVTAYIFKFGSHFDSSDTLSPAQRVFYESLRQQLSEDCGFVCPFFYQQRRKGEGCCGAKAVLRRLFRRLPDEYKSKFNQPNCGLIC